MKIKNKLIAGMLSACMAFSVIQITETTAHAASESAVLLVDENFDVPGIKGGQESSIWFGNYTQSSNGSNGYNTEPVKWRVLDNADSSLFLLADKNLLRAQYNSNWTAITWENSVIRSTLNNSFFSALFSDKEKVSVTSTTVKNDDNARYGTPGGNDTKDKIFLLSISEAVNEKYGFASEHFDSKTRETKNTDFVKNKGGQTSAEGNGLWWLRSPGIYARNVAFVDDYGCVSRFGECVDSSIIGIRPAFNFDLKSAVLVTAAAGGKSDTVGENALTKVGENSSNEWKMTLKDTQHENFVVESVNSDDEKVLEIKYKGAVTGDNEYISAIIKSSSGSVKYYGKLALASNAAGASVKINIDGKMGVKDTLFVFNEQCNADYKTDYASAMQKIATASQTELENAIKEAKDELDATDKTPFNEKELEVVEKIIEDAKKALDDATSISEVDDIKNEAIDNIKKVKINPSDNVSGVSLNVRDVVLNKGKSLTLKETVSPGTAKDKSVTWASSDTKVATVDKKGKVTGVKQGTAKITVTTNDGKKTATANVRVLFDDVKKGHTFYNPIYWAADNGVTYGVAGTNKFAPSSTVTRGQVIAFLYRMDGNPKTTGYKNLFKDVTSKSTFYNPILWGGKSQVVAGYPDGTFREKVTCTRGQIVAFIWRMAGKPEPKAKKSSFKDVNAKNTFYKAILWAAEKGITVGYSDGTFKATGNCTRGQMVAFLQRFAKQYPSKVKI